MNVKCVEGIVGADDEDQVAVFPAGFKSIEKGGVLSFALELLQREPIRLGGEYAPEGIHGVRGTVVLLEDELRGRWQGRELIRLGVPLGPQLML